MSILGAVTADELKIPQAKPLIGKFIATIEVARIEEKPNGVQLSVQHGNLRTREGEANFGNRKIFGNFWIDYTAPNGKVYEPGKHPKQIGNALIHQLLVSAGIMQGVEGEEDPFSSTEEMAAEIVGKDVRPVTKPKIKQDGTPDAAVAGYDKP